MRYPRYVLLLVLLMSTLFSQAQLLGRITVKAGQYARHNTIIRVALPQFHIQLMSAELLNVEGGKKIVTPVQMEGEHTIVWRLEGDLPAGAERVYELWSKKDYDRVAKVTVRTTNTAYIVEKDNKPVLQYNYAVMEPPAGVDTAFRRSGFIHPAYTPSGKVLTNIHPKDHYHHFGIWNPWTDTKFENDTVDFWNLKKLSGTVRFSQPARTMNGKVFGGFLVTQQHVVLSKPEKTAMVEFLEVLAYDGKDKEQVWDYNSRLRCAGKSPITLLEYRYGGGFAIRGAGEWNNENSAVLTSEGKTRKDADNTHARWFKIAGALNGGKGGLLVLSAPDNFNSPQPVRIWPEKDQNGQVFAMFSPTKDREWVLTPGNEYPQKYRVITFDGDLTTAQAEAYYNDYAFPPECTFSK
ncbi:DUF6807 domain-containing protein [Chitinophaga niabensis]|uniref:Methane oxygenase PmoA n=1 Tax=Chitinophaga niabensis TaxID=536979 RepID=A0A1N6D1S5_9BACT|nr:PmoA family protein [Chitinophaga niabensis]SIN64770.1 Methane oxygenase PmoA [Chitinophaga niabensis]